MFGSILFKFLKNGLSKNTLKARQMAKLTDDNLIYACWPRPQRPNEGEVAPADAPLKHGGGDGTYGGMEIRVAKLESDLAHVQGDLKLVQTDVRKIQEDLGGTGGVRERLSRIEERVAHLPTKGFFVTGLLSMLVVIAALTVFQGNIQRIFGLTISQSGAGAAPSTKIP